MNNEINNVLNDVEQRVSNSNDLNNKINEFLINRDEEETKITLEFAKALLALDIEIQEIRNDQKEIRKQAKDNGVSVGKVNKVINNLKRAAKEKDVNLTELEMIENVLNSDVDVRTMIDTLTVTK